MDIFKDLGIGVPNGLKATEKADLVNIVNGAVANNDIIKTSMINAINSKLGSSLTLDKGWADVQSAISGWINPLSSNKRWAIGTVKATGIYVNDLTFTLNNGTLTSDYVTVTGLTFKPSIICLVGESEGTTYSVFYNYNSSILYKLASYYANNNGTLNPYKIQSPVSVTETSFLLPAHLDITYNWIAIE